VGEAFKISVKWHPSTNPDTIWSRLASRLGRAPTDQEAADEVRRILREPLSTQEQSR